MGEDVPPNFKQGDEVYGQASVFTGGSGAFAELALANKDSIAHKPKTLTPNDKQYKNLEQIK